MSSLGSYILDDNDNPVETTTLEWGRWMEENRDRKRIALDSVGAIMVSTVFLGLDHNFMGIGAPLLFETMVFADPEKSMLEDYTERYHTKTEALEGHKRILEMVQEGRLPTRYDE